METSIRIMEKTKKKLNLVKYKLGLKSLDQVIEKMYNTIVKFKLMEEMKELKK